MGNGQTFEGTWLTGQNTSHSILLGLNLPANATHYTLLCYEKRFF